MALEKERDMSRMPRGIDLDRQGVYHVRGQVCGRQGFYPLQEKENAQELTRLIRHYVGLYFCEAAALEIMGSHYHLPLVFDALHEVSRQQLRRLAERFYPGTYRPYLRWRDREWRRFHHRLFNISELMRNVQQEFTRWYNRRNKRKGPFWAGRFRSTDTRNLAETVLYVELNAVRAHLVKRPEDWRFSSAWMRKHRQDRWLMPLEELFDTRDRALAERTYWVRLNDRGTLPSKEEDTRISVAAEVAGVNFARGCYLSRLDAFSRGRMVDNYEAILMRIQEYREAGIYRRRRYPIPVGVGDLYSLREARSTYLRI